MIKQAHFIGFKLDDQTLALLQELIKVSEKKKRSAVIRACIQEHAKRVLADRQEARNG